MRPVDCRVPTERRLIMLWPPRLLGALPPRSEPSATDGARPIWPPLGAAFSSPESISSSDKAALKLASPMKPPPGGCIIGSFSPLSELVLTPHDAFLGAMRAPSSS